MHTYKKLVLELLLFTAFIFGLDLVSYNYLFFHVIVELFSITIMCVLFAVTVNAYKYLDNRYLIFVGTSGLFIAVLDLLHTLTFYGMNIVPSDQFYANQFWVATRFFESSVLLLGFLYVAWRKTIRIITLIAVYTLITVFIILSILYFEIFPVCYIKGVGQTSFKIISEYVIIFILSFSLCLLVYNKKHFATDIYYLLLISISLTILSEFSFTLYVANYDFVNKLGHIFKVLSFYLIFKANISHGFNKPMETYFRELKLSEEKIKEYSIELEKEISTRNKFFSIISHDLKNPFTVIMGYSELLLKKHANIENETRERFIKMIFDSTRQTLNLLENLLAWSRTQNKTMPFEPREFELEEMIEKNIRLITANAVAKEIEIEKTITNYKVYADVDMVNAVLRNLLTNAIKFTPKGGKIRITTSEESDGFIVICIEDTGVGMPEEKVKSLFRIEKTYSAKGTENETGTGLGLILANEFVAKNQGKIWVESVEGKGSKFSFSLKLAR